MIGELKNTPQRLIKNAAWRRRSLTISNLWGNTNMSNIFTMSPGREGERYSGERPEDSI